ncbi:hypothetical protein JCM15831A_23930 [Asaia astilbis]
MGRPAMCVHHFEGALFRRVKGKHVGATRQSNLFTKWRHWEKRANGRLKELWTQSQCDSANGHAEQ